MVIMKTHEDQLIKLHQNPIPNDFSIFLNHSEKHLGIGGTDIGLLITIEVNRCLT